jgi:flavodoxin
MRSSGIRPGFSSPDSGGAGASGPSGRILVAYYSFGGTTEKLAERISALAKGELFRIKPAVPYPEEEGRLSEIARKEGESGELPELASALPDLSGYGVVLVGSPVWWFGLAGPARAFVSKADLSGKRTGLFVTHGGGGPSKSLDAARKLNPEAGFVSVLSVAGNGAGGLEGSPDKAISEWLERLLGPVAG